MRIESVAMRVPTLAMTNEDILGYLEKFSDGVSKQMLKTYQRLVRGLLMKAGSRVRYRRDKERDEKASDFVLDAMQDAFDTAEMSAKDIDVLIFCGVGRGFLEPANAYFYAAEMDMSCSCFDIADACMSWTRSLEVAQGLFQGGLYKHIMIINGEFNMELGFPDNFVVDGLKKLEYTFPTYTIGEAATATIVSSLSPDWSFNYITRADLCDLCNIPLDPFDNFVNPSVRIGRNGTYNLSAYGREMFASAEEHLSKLLKDVIGDLDEPDIYFPHAASSTAYLTAGEKVGIKREKMYSEVFPRYGNVVSASIPVGICLAIDEERLKRGHKVVLCPASAGMTYAVVRYTY